MKLEIVTPKESLLTKEVEYISIPSKMGEIGILPGHISLISELTSGVLQYRSSGKENKIAIHYGFVEVQNDQITIVADEAETADQIDVKKTKENLKIVESNIQEEIKKLSIDYKKFSEYQIQALKYKTQQKVVSV